MRRHFGFTLIELLTVCAVLAALSYVAWGAYMGVDRQAENELAGVELRHLAQALKRFHGDTGYWPGEGPFRYSEGCAESDAGLLGVAAAFSATGNPAGYAAWYASPANFSLLFTPPELCPGRPLAFLSSWDSERRRGWNGPYLPLDRLRWLDLDEELGGIPSFGAGPAFAPREDASGCAADFNACFLRWRMLPVSTSGYRADRHEYARHARPFLFFLDPPRVVYWGADGRFGGNPASGSLCLPNAANSDGQDDLVICL
ncbi:MAG: prepilin-type N-terminal cleavage/methylation domain-containing protein [Zoogloeaceae bacterium]|jgi:prepilin-type N-terminal cleavage/methylation domain-containing protein|nr:prepilin-type N-terminal cleavage/methylation domain-containing protein [Zoogloeaceae bacterium]